MKADAEAKNGKRILFFLVIGVLALNAAILYKVLVPSEPTFQGKTVEQWCEAINLGHLPPEVVNAFGVKAAPYLVRVARRTKSPINRFAWLFWQKLPRAFRRDYARFRPESVVGTRGTAQVWLIQLGPDAKNVVPDVIAMTRPGNHAEVRSGGVELLGFVGQDSPEALRTLIGLLKDKDVTIQDQAALATGRFRSAGEKAVPALVEFLQHHPQGRPFNPILALGDIGPLAVEAEPSIAAAMIRNPVLRMNGLHALAKIGVSESNSLAAIRPLLEDADPLVQIMALQALAKSGGVVWSVRSTLEALKTNRTDIVRILAAVTLAKSEGGLEMAMPLLLEELRPKKSGVKENLIIDLSHSGWPYRISFGVLGPDAAGWFLGEIGLPAREALPALREMMNASDDRRRVMAARSVWRISRRVRETLPTLLAALAFANRDNDDFPFHVAIQTLTEMGPAAQEAAPVLSEFIQQKTNRWIARREVWSALVRIDSPTALKVSVR